MAALMAPLLVALVATVLLHGAAAANNVETTALLNFKAATDGTAWIFGSWVPDSTGTPCAWDGVYCNALQKVTSLQLSCQNIFGSFTTDIFKLTAMQDLELGYNQLQGPLPTGFQALNKLTYMDLSWNQFTGGIPAKISTMGQLVTLWMGGNQFTGAVPSAIFKLAKLQNLDFSNNLLSGKLPDFYVKNRVVINPYSTSIQNFWLNDNSFSGNIPGAIGGIGGLQTLDFHNNAFSGKLPNALSGLTAVTFLNLGDNQLVDWIPDFMSNMVSLEYLYLYNNQLTAFYKDLWVGLAPSLRLLDISYNSFTNNLPFLTSLTTLEVLIANSNNFSYNPIPDFSGAPNLFGLELSDNHIPGGIPATLFKNQNLFWIGLANNQLSGKFPTFDCSNIEWLSYASFGGNQLTGKFPTSLNACPWMYLIDVSRNQLSGTLPPINTGLGVLDVNTNNFNGPIPDSLANNWWMWYLDLSYNKLTGPIPDQLNIDGGLWIFSVATNNLTGQIPFPVSYFPAESFANNPLLCGYPLPDCLP